MSKSNVLLMLLTILGVSIIGCKKEPITTSTTVTNIIDSTTTTTTTTTTTNNTTNNYYTDSTNNNTTPSSHRIHKYLFMGHTYYGSETMDPRIIPMIDRNEYEQFWLGGDICAETTQKSSTVDYVDSLFDLGSPKTHWALGNHDTRNGNVQWITDKTGRPTYYTTTFNGICMLVLNTNFRYGPGNYDVANTNAQYDMIKQVCDTIQHSSHLIVMSHGALWSYISGVNVGPTLCNADRSRCLCNGDHSYYLLHINPDENYESAIYPMLTNVASRGINVMHLSGDFGQFSTGYQASTVDGVQFLGSGVTSEIPWSQQFPTNGMLDMVLVFEHDLDDQTITWKFETL